MTIEAKTQAKFSIRFRVKKCSYCGSNFIYQHPNQRTCSPECAKARQLEGARKGGRLTKKEVKDEAR